MKNTMCHVKITGFNMAFGLELGMQRRGRSTENLGCGFRGSRVLCSVVLEHNIAVRQIRVQALSLPSGSSLRYNYTKLLPAFSILLLLLFSCFSTWIPRTFSLYTTNTNTSSLCTGQSQLAVQISCHSLWNKST